MFGRTEDIIEIQEGNLVDNMDSACSVENMDDDNLPFTTLISKQNIKQFLESKFYFRFLSRCWSAYKTLHKWRQLQRYRT